MQEVISPRNIWSSAEFFDAKMLEQEARRERYLTNAYLLEPNVKESSGGLRDIQMISWVCQRQFATHDLSDLVTNELLTTEEFAILWDGLELLWRVRYLLHHTTGRREDRLLFDHQRGIAHALGYIEDENNQCIEQLMQRYYRTVMQLQRLNEILLQGVGGIISGVTAASPVESINSRFHVRNGFLEVTHDAVFRDYHPALLEIFLVFGQTPNAVNIRSNTIRLIRSSLPLINDRFRSDPAVRALFLRIFVEPNKLTRKIRMMNRYGVLAAYIPAFDQIVGRMQYDLFHVYTVDEHTTRVITNARRYALKKHELELPHCTHVMTQIDKPELLYLIALFHDIAKGRGGDHSELGALDMQTFAQSHNLCEDDVDLCRWVVSKHLLMSTTAQRKDITDPAVQLEFAHEVGSSRRLHYLYLLTVADIRATNPELWNSFKQTLLQSLYTACIKILQRGLQSALDDAAVLKARKSHARTLLDATGNDEHAVTRLWDSFNDDYFRQYQSVEIARHSESILNQHNASETLIATRQSASRGATEVLIYTPHSHTLFAVITRALEAQQLNVLSANVTTTSAALALHVFYVLETDGSVINDTARIEAVRQTITAGVSAPHDLSGTITGRVPRQARHFDTAVQVRFDNESPQHGTERIEDVFTVTTVNGDALRDSTAQDALRTRLCEEL